MLLAVGGLIIANLVGAIMILWWRHRAKMWEMRYQGIATKFYTLMDINKALLKSMHIPIEREAALREAMVHLESLNVGQKMKWPAKPGHTP